MKNLARNAAILGTITVSVAALTACASPSGGGNANSSAAGGSGIKITYVPGSVGDPYFGALRCGAEAEAKKLGVSLNTQGATSYSAPLQVPIVQSVAATKPSAMIVAPTDRSALQAPLNQAQKAGIKLVLVDTTLNDPSIAVSAISSDNEEGGRKGFEAIKELVPNGGKVLVIGVQPGVSTDDQRIVGFESGIKAESKYQYLGVQFSQNDAQKGASIVNAALQKDPDIVAIFATNEIGAQAVATGVRQAGKQNAVKVVGFDALPGQIENLKNGTVQALIAQEPAQMGKEAVAQAVKAIKGEPTTKEILTKFTILTKGNVDTPEGKAAVYAEHC